MCEKFWTMLRNIVAVFTLIVITAPAVTIGFYENTWESKSNPCPLMYPHQFIGYAPIGNVSAGNFSEIDQYTLKSCTVACCLKPTCNIVFMHDTTCYHVECVSDELCMPLVRHDMKNHATLVLIRPVLDGVSWTELIENRPNPSTIMDGEDMLADESAYPEETSTSKLCKPDISNTCKENEECVQDTQKSRWGICQCMLGFTRNISGACQRDDLPKITLKEISTLKPTKKQLTVSALSKEVRLPESEETLSAFAVPNPPEGQHYSYEWTLLTRPEKSTGTMSDQDGASLHLTHLTEGLYTFKVTVSNSDSFGQTLANVSVLPPKRINRPPTVVITPAEQIVRLPNTGAVLDGSSSHDDDGIKVWHWDLQRGPLGYSPLLPETSTLQLKDLSVPGNYTFRLTVTDTDKATNSTTANITVMKVTDYPPDANAGQNVIIYLPHNELTLNGNLSTDDHEITSWEWTKSSGDADKAADMQDTRTPYLRLSHLEEGMYTFVLRVTDSAGQNSNADVHVFVKPASHKPPEAHAGNNLTISLPQTSTLLDGSGTSESGHVVSYLWEKISGPDGIVFECANASRTNITHLSRGQYILRLTVVDDSGNSASDTVIVNVTQIKNERPKANAGGDQIIELPQSVITLNGSGSQDDVGIVSWQWSREDISLAIGNILGDSDTKPLLLLSDLEPGRYVFRLKVADEEGVTDEDTASVMVKPDPMLPYLVELTLGTQARTLTQSQVKGVMQEVGLLVRDEAVLSIRTIRTERPGGRAVLSLLAHSGTHVVPAVKVERLLKDKLRRDSSLLRLSVSSLRTTICQNNCSNHGVCDEHSRRCLCEAFWMQNLFGKYFGNGDADCEWSVLYVVVGLCTAGLCLGGLVWGVAFLCSRACYHRRIRSSIQRPPRYALLGDDEQPTFSGPKLTVSETDTDSDVLFESRNKSGRRELMGNGHAKASRNGFIKLGRRVKT